MFNSVLQSFVCLSVLASSLVNAMPAPIPLFGINIHSGSESNDATSAVSQSTIDSSLLRPALFSRVAYCDSQQTQALTCGTPCDAIKGTNILQVGGDGDATPRFFIASDPQSQSVVVAHQGTDPTEFLSLLNDAEVAQVAMDSARFPQAASGTLVHDGFQDTQNRTSSVVLSAVQSALQSTGFTRVLTTGHSLGAAVATLDALMLKMALPSNIEVDSVVFGLPRVGNQPFADMVDAMFPTFTHVTNQNDPIPIVPPHTLNFQQPSGEAHINSVDSSSGNANMVSCPDQENDNCSDKNLIADPFGITNHLGPYFSGISFGGSAC